MDKKEDRRRFLKGASTGLIGAGLIAGSCGPGPGARRREHESGSERSVRWKLASSFPGSLDVLYGAAEELARRVEEMSNGRFVIDTYQGGEIVPALEVLDAVSRGSVDMGHTASYYFIGKNPALAFDCTVPFGLTARQQNAWMYYGGGQELMRELFDDFNILNYPGGNTGVQMGGWFREPVSDLNDLRGRKMRIPGLGGKVMERLGVTAQVIPGGEVYISLERGAIDAAEWVGPYDDFRLGLHEVAKHYYYPGWWEPGAMLSYYVNQDAYNRLPVSYKSMLETACAESNVRMMAAYDARNVEALKKIVDSGVQLHPFPADVMEAAERATEEIMEETASSNPEYRRVYEAFREWRQSAADWFSLAEETYIRTGLGRAVSRSDKNRRSP